MPHAIADEVLYLDVAIIGAGWYGLKAASTMLKLAPKTKLAVFDKYDSVGGTWSRDRVYPNLVAQAEFGYFNYPSTPMSRDGKPNTNLVSGDMICNYLEKFAEDNDLRRHIRFNSWVSNVERAAQGSGWVLSVNGRKVEAAKLICATGVTTQSIPPCFIVEDGAIPVKHVVELAKESARFEDPSSNLEHFVLVGSAKSAYDAAYLLCSLGKKVTWVIREDGSGPMPIMPITLLGRNSITMSSSRLMSNLSPSLMTTDSWVGSFFHRTWLGRWLTKTAWGYITKKADQAAGFGTTEGPTELLKPNIQDNSTFWCDSSLGLITMEDFWTTLRKGDLTIVRDSIDTADEKGVKLVSGERVAADYVIYATGWGDHFGFFSAELKDELGIPHYANPGGRSSVVAGKDVTMSTGKPNHKGNNPGASDFWAAQDQAADEVVARKLPLLGAGPADFDGWKIPESRQRAMKVRRWRLYNRMVPINVGAQQEGKDNDKDRSIVVLGQIHTTQTPTVAEIQSLWAAAYLLGHDVGLPGAASGSSSMDMVREVAEWNAWTRKRYASVGERYPYALFDWVPYLDRLMRDLGLEAKRHGGGLTEFFAPYRPLCYHGVVDEYMAKRKMLVGA
ncbi:flavin-binding monooxygenase-like family protein [Xylariomycetidae sp. FL2044]|nr:flavin-binding monooxygenase-like family protein [Xylariomycetidae sp. FL2044]